MKRKKSQNQDVTSMEAIFFAYFLFSHSKVSSSFSKKNPDMDDCRGFVHSVICQLRDAK